MATAEYIVGRKTYRRPQALCFAESEPAEINDPTYGMLLVPSGNEFSDFIILSDHGRQALNMGVERLGTQKRGINGRMRSYWIADKLSISVSWDNLPSRGWPTGQSINDYVDNAGNHYSSPGVGRTLVNSNKSVGINLADYSERFTVDGGAGGNELLEWYKGHQGSFWVLLAYDRYPTVGDYTSLGRYNESIEMFISDFSYDVVKRGGTNMDFWNIDIKLEEA